MKHHPDERRLSEIMIQTFRKNSSTICAPYFNALHNCTPCELGGAVSSPPLPPKVDQAIGKGLWTKQLSLLADQTIEQSESDECKMALEPVPQDIRLGSKLRFRFTVRQYGLAWHYPLQPYLKEANTLLPHLQNLNLEMDESKGYPIEAPLIHAQIEYLVDTWLPSQQQRQQQNWRAAA